jgi:hypothetical protein
VHCEGKVPLPVMAMLREYCLFVKLSLNYEVYGWWG